MQRRRTLTFWISVLLIVVLEACGSQTQPQEHSMEEGSMPELTVETVLAQLKEANISNVIVSTPETDPVKLLGRPGQYIERASFQLPGGWTNIESVDRVERGGVIEVFNTSNEAKARSLFIQDTKQANPILGTEYHYTRKNVLVRVTGDINPWDAKKVEAALNKL